MRRNSGQIPIAALIGLVASVILAAASSFVVADQRSQDRDYDQIQRIAAMEAKIERLPAIESKLDLLLQKSGIESKTLTKDGNKVE